MATAGHCRDGSARLITFLLRPSLPSVPSVVKRAASRHAGAFGFTTENTGIESETRGLISNLAAFVPALPP